jgi:hypothetical protein
MTIYLFNSLVVPANFDKYSRATVRIERITIEQARQILSRQSFISAIGHTGTASLLSRILGIPIPANRITIYLEKGDIVIAFFLKVRIPEGIVLSESELQKLEYWFVKYEVIDLQ